MTDLATLLLFVITTLLALAAGALAGQSVLGDLNRVSRRAKHPLRFQLSDLLAFMFYLQLGLALPIATFRAFDSSPLPLLIVFSMIVMSILWLAAVTTISAADVTEPKRRATFVLLVLPGTLILVGAVIVYMYTLFVAAISRFEPWFGYEPASLAHIATMAAIGGGIVAIWIALRALCRWILPDVNSSRSSKTSFELRAAKIRQDFNDKSRRV